MATKRYWAGVGRCAGLPLLLAVFMASAQPLIPDPDPALRAALIEAVEASDSFGHRFDAEVWLLDMSGRLQRFIPDDNDRLQFLQLVHTEARRANVSPELVLALIEVESLFDRFAISSAGALGFMQVMPFWLKELGRPDDNLFNPQTNLRYGCTILRHYLDRERDSLIPALARYNGSYGKTWYAERVLKAFERRWRP
jgi:soluble lytic murein transglycosylase-like protein